MVWFLVYINNKSKINDRFTFSGIVNLTEPCLPLSLIHITFKLISYELRMIIRIIKLFKRHFPIFLHNNIILKTFLKKKHFK